MRQTDKLAKGWPAVNVAQWQQRENKVSCVGKRINAKNDCCCRKLYSITNSQLMRWTLTRNYLKLVTRLAPEWVGLLSTVHECHCSLIGEVWIGAVCRIVKAHQQIESTAKWLLSWVRWMSELIDWTTQIVANATVSMCRIGASPTLNYMEWIKQTEFSAVWLSAFE